MPVPTKAPPDLDLLDVHQLSATLGVPKATIYAWSTSGTGPDRIRIGRHVRFRRSDVDAWLARRTVHADGTPSTTADPGRRTPSDR